MEHLVEQLNQEEQRLLEMVDSARESLLKSKYAFSHTSFFFDPKIWSQLEKEVDEKTKYHNKMSKAYFTFTTNKSHIDFHKIPEDEDASKFIERLKIPWSPWD